MFGKGFGLFSGFELPLGVFGDAEEQHPDPRPRGLFIQLLLPGPAPAKDASLGRLTETLPSSVTLWGRQE